MKVDRHVWIVVLITASMLASCAGASKYTAMYVFGDSLLDAGNNKYFPDSIAKADFLPYGIDFKAGPTGRFSNGKNLADFLAEMVGLPLLPSYADVIEKGASFLKGVNYASAGAGILPNTGYRFGRVISLAGQVSNLKKTVDKVREQMQGNENEVSKYLAKALVFMDIGANDYLNNYLEPEVYGTSLVYNLPQFVDLLVDRYTKHVLEIQGLGLRKFLISDASPIGCGPLRIRNKVCNATLNSMVTMLNRGLEIMVHYLNSNHPESQFIYLPSMPIYLKFYANAEAYGFKVKDKACCGKSDTNGTKPLCFKDTVPCPNRDEYLFWDAAHPTEAGNRVFANLVFNATSL